MKLRIVFCLVTLNAALSEGQVILGGGRGPVMLPPGDAAVLASREVRTDLACSVRPLPTELGFDLALHGGYEVQVPVEELTGGGNSLTAIFRISPEGYADKEIHFSQRWTVPPITEDAKGTARLHGVYVSGEGRYRVDWLLRDRKKRYCTAHWQFSANPRGKDKQIALRLAPGIIEPEIADPFAREAPVNRSTEHPLHLLVLANIEAQAATDLVARNSRTWAVLSILRSIAREPRIGSYSIAAFNLDRKEVLFRRENVPQVDFPALGEALRQAHLGTIDVKSLRQDNSGIRFLGDLLEEEMARNRPDALIVVGSKTTVWDRVDRAVKEHGEPACPVFYLNYNADPDGNPWRDAIGSIVKLRKGVDYTITRPRDLFLAWNAVMSRISDGGPIGEPNPTATIRPPRTK